MAGAAAVPATVYRDDFWRSLLYFNVYRGLVPVVMFAIWLLDQDLLFGRAKPQLFFWVMALYAVFSAVAFVGIVARRPGFETQLTAHSLADVLFVVLAMHASGGISSGLGLLLIASQAGAALISRGRMMLFYAAVGSLAVLCEQALRVLQQPDSSGQMVQAALLKAASRATPRFTRSSGATRRRSRRILKPRPPA